MTRFSRIRLLLALAACASLLRPGPPWPGDLGPGRPVLLAYELPDAVVQAEQARIAAIAKASEAAVSIFGPGDSGGGSGVVITPDGYALTNFHVAKPAGDYMKCSLPDGRLYDAVIVGADPTGDVALIKLLGREDFPYAEMGDSDEVRVGDWCFAVGNPFLLATDFQPTVTYGIVSGVHRYQYPAGTLLEYADCIQTDASINPGNSGGPLFNARGQLIGINGRGSFEKRGRVNVGVGYAISINQIKNFMGHLRSGRIVDHATLGASVSSDGEGRVIVTNILESSDAYRRGLRYGDEIVAFGGRPIATVNAFKNVLGIFPKGWRIPLSFRRGGQRRDVLVRLSGVHSQEELIAKVQRQPIQPPDPAPKDREKDPPGDPQPDQPDPERRKPPIPTRLPRFHGGPAAPKEVAQYIKPRPGYANYYFNELNRDRVWTAFTASSDLKDLTGVWTLQGQLAGGGPIEIQLGGSEAVGAFPAGQATVNAGKDLDQQLDPAGSGGLLVALHLWRRLLTLGPQKYGEVYYLGAAPVVDRDGLFDVLVATYDVVETQFLFDPDSGRLVGVEMYPDAGVDPCEIYFDDYREVQGRLLPHHLQVRYGDRVFAEIQLDKFDLSKAAEKEA